LSTITGDVCYRSTSLFLDYSSCNKSTITFVVSPDDQSSPTTIKVSDIINHYLKKGANDLVTKIDYDLNYYSKLLYGRVQKKFSYDELWLHMPVHPNGLQGIFCPKQKESSSIVSNFFSLK
jgi:hypothetical protein